MTMNELIKERNFLLGSLVYEWICAVEFMKHIVNEVERSSGTCETVWMECRNGNPWQIHDRDIIKKFKNIGTSDRVKCCVKYHQRVIECLEKGVNARDDLMHKIGTECSKTIPDIRYEGPDTERHCSAIRQEIEIIERHDSTMRNVAKSMRRFLEEFEGISAVVEPY